MHHTLTALRIEARWALADTLAMARRNLIRYVRSPELLVFSTINPVMFVLLFTYVFGGAIDVGPGNYIDFLLPGILVQTVVFGAVQTGVGLAEDLSSGMVDRYRSLPMARSAVMAGRILADTVRNVFVVLLMIGVGYAIGFRFNASAAAIIAVPIVLVIFGQAFSWISAAIGVSVREAETAQVAGFIWIFPLTFHELDVRAGAHDAGVVGGLRERQSDHGDGGPVARADAGRRDHAVAVAGRRLDRRPGGLLLDGGHHAVPAAFLARAISWRLVKPPLQSELVTTQCQRAWHRRD